MIHSLIVCFFLIASMACAQIQMSLRVHCQSYSLLKEMRALSQAKLAPKALSLINVACSSSQSFFSLGENNEKTKYHLKRPLWWK